jgi:hypothetical protein
MPASVLFQRVERDLDELRARGESLPQTGQAYIAQWLKQGFLERDFPDKAQEEVYELSAKAHQAIRFVDGLADTKLSATESRLNTVIHQLSQLVQQTDPNDFNRIKSLEQEKKRLDDEIAAIQQGKGKRLSDERAIERVKDIIYLSQDLADDFRLVREEFRKLNVEFRKEILESEGSRGDVLDRLFDGVDVIAQSDAGKTFNAFWRMLTDPQMNLEFEGSLDQLMARDFTSQLTREERLFLLKLSQIFLAKGKDVHDVLDGFSSSLRQFVQKREFQKKRRLTQLIGNAQKDALILKEHIHSISDLNFELSLTGSRISSISQLQLFDPEEDRYEGGLQTSHTQEVSLDLIAGLIEASEIDFEDLKDNILEQLKTRQQISIGQLLAIYPAKQGLGTVVGYVVLGTKYGVKSQQEEAVAWDADGESYRARLPQIWFIKENAHALR